jgi:hypothetical protein
MLPVMLADPLGQSPATSRGFDARLARGSPLNGGLLASDR